MNKQYTDEELLGEDPGGFSNDEITWALLVGGIMLSILAIPFFGLIWWIIHSLYKFVT